MLTETTIYFITRLDDMKHVLTGACVISGVLLIISTIAILILLNDLTEPRNNDEWKQLIKWWKSVRLSCFVLFIVSFITYPFVPTTREMAAIKIIPAIVNSQDVQEIGQDFKVLAKEWLDELRPQKNPSSKQNVSP